MRGILSRMPVQHRHQKTMRPRQQPQVAQKNGKTFKAKTSPETLHAETLKSSFLLNASFNISQYVEEVRLRPHGRHGKGRSNLQQTLSLKRMRLLPVQTSNPQRCVAVSCHHTDWHDMDALECITKFADPGLEVPKKINNSSLSA